MEGAARSISLSLAIMAAVISLLPFGCDGVSEPEVWTEQVGERPNVDVSRGNTSVTLQGRLLIQWPEGIDTIEVFLESGLFDERTTIMDHVEIRYPADNISFNVTAQVMEGSRAGTDSIPVSGVFSFIDSGHKITRQLSPVWFGYLVDPFMDLGIEPWHGDDIEISIRPGSWGDIWAMVSNNGNEGVICRLRAVNEIPLATLGITVHRPDWSLNVEKWIGAGEMEMIQLQFNVSHSTRSGRHIVLLGVEYQDGGGIWMPYDLDPLEMYIIVGSDRDNDPWPLSTGPEVPVIVVYTVFLALITTIRRSLGRKGHRLDRGHQ